MEGPPESSSPRSARPRRAPVVTLLVVAAVCVLVGRGLGWLGNGDDARSDREPSRPRFVNGRADAAAAPSPTPSRPDVETSAVTAATPAALPSAPPVQRTPTPPRPEATPGPGIEADRYAAIRSLIDVRSGSGQTGEALGAIDRAAALPLSETQAADLAALREAAEAAADRRIAAIAAAIREGRILEAHKTAVDVLTAGPASLHRRFLAGIEAPGTDDAARAPRMDERPWPLPAALAKDRVVRTQLAGETITGRVVDSRSDEVTLRVQEGQDVTFPTVRAAACEPVDPTAAEAIELGLAALHAKDALLARLWFACARARGALANDSRSARLGELLK